MQKRRRFNPGTWTETTRVDHVQMFGVETKVIWVGLMLPSNPRRYILTLIPRQLIIRTVPIKANRFHGRTVSPAMNAHVGLIRRITDLIK